MLIEVAKYMFVGPSNTQNYIKNIQDKGFGHESKMAATMAAKSVNAHVSFHKEVRMLIKVAKYMFSRPRNTRKHLSNVQD